MSKDIDVSRIVAAIEFRDAVTDGRIRSPLKVAIPGSKMTTNNSGFHIVWTATGFDEYSAAFDADPLPAPAAVGPLAGSVEDPAGRYLLRLFSIAVPQLDPKKPVTVKLYPTATAGLRSNWAAVRVRATRSDTKAGIEGVYIRVTRQDNAATYLGMTGPLGEALVPVPDVPHVAPQPAPINGNLFTRKFAAVVQAFAEPEFAPSRDPDQFQASRLGVLKSSAPLPVELTAGREISREIVINAN